MYAHGRVYLYVCACLRSLDTRQRAYFASEWAETVEGPYHCSFLAQNGLPPLFFVFTIYIFMYVCVYAYLFVHVYIYLYVYIYIYMCTHI